MISSGNRYFCRAAQPPGKVIGEEERGKSIDPLGHARCAILVVVKVKQRELVTEPSSKFFGGEFEAKVGESPSLIFGIGKGASIHTLFPNLFCSQQSISRILRAVVVINRRNDTEIRHTWRDVGPCRVRLASLTDGAIFQTFLTDEEQFGNLQFGENSD